MYLPINYEKINISTGTYSPNYYKPCNNDTYDYWCRSLFQRALSVIKIEGTPDTWDKNTLDFLFWCLFRYGYVACFNSNKFGKSFQPCTLSGYDFYYQFTEAIITNPKLKVTLQIHKDCEILKIAPDYLGIWDIIDKYARLLSEIEPSITMAIINSKFSRIWGARNKSGATFLRKVWDRIHRGEPGVIFETSTLLPIDKVTKEDVVVDLSPKDVKSSYIGSELLKDRDTILNQFDSEIGIPTLPYQKKERMVTDEAESKQEDATSRSKVWVDTMNGCFKSINKMLGTNMVAIHNYDDVSRETSDERGEGDE